MLLLIFHSCGYLFTELLLNVLVNVIKLDIIYTLMFMLSTIILCSVRSSVGFRQSQETMGLCAAEFSSVSPSSGVAEETDAGVAFSVALSTDEGRSPVCYVQ